MLSTITPVALSDLPRLQLKGLSGTSPQQINPTSDSVTMRKLHDLPDDILITILSACDIETIFALRLSCTNLCAVFNTYIRTIAPLVARNTFPDCNTLLTPPESGYSIEWLRRLVPEQLASIVLDKDKLRRYPYIHSGFPYGIPSESICSEAKHWRERITSGWRILQSFYLISQSVYAKSEDELKRPNAIRRVSNGMRSSRLWQAMACPYPGCTEHGMRHVFDGKGRRSSNSSYSDKQDEVMADVQRRESIILEKRLALLERLSDHDLLNYVYVWRLLYWTFRPYRKPHTSAPTANLPNAAQLNWSPIITDISNGCSWLNWFVLSVGAAPFLHQWSLTPSPSPPTSASSTTSPQTHTLRDLIWAAYTTRTSHRIEVEREYICKFEFALRKRCLTPERLKRLEAEILRGRSIRTISLDCIPWVYEQHPLISRPPADFPWYEAGKWVWLDGEWYLQSVPGAGWAQPGMLRLSLKRVGCGEEEEEGMEGMAGEDGDGDGEKEGVGFAKKGPLRNVAYLVYLGVEDAERVWLKGGEDASEFAF
ncbi:hypothetical protein IQ07DRAFT_134410 [Pyrenochaeta sp. DS3sAY3a]|nr:hypothetical protein IQ07DRAFT_134410 [Pyrenochaeta sp. DS3sAY3a]